MPRLTLLALMLACVAALTACTGNEIDKETAFVLGEPSFEGLKVRATQHGPAAGGKDIPFSIRLRTVRGQGLGPFEPDGITAHIHPDLPTSLRESEPGRWVGRVKAPLPLGDNPKLIVDIDFKAPNLTNLPVNYPLFVD